MSIYKSMSSRIVSHSRHHVTDCAPQVSDRTDTLPTVRKLANAPCGLEARTQLAVYWTYFMLRRGHNLAYTGQRRRCRGFGRCAGACWAMSVANRNRSSMRKCERPADIRTNGSGGAMLVHAVGRYRSSSPSSRKQTRSSPQARYWSMSWSSRP